MTDTALLMTDFTVKNISGDRDLFSENQTFILDCIPERQEMFLVVSWLQENGSGILISVM